MKPKFWQLDNPQGETVVKYASNRFDAISRGFNPDFGMPVKVMRQLVDLSREVAGWDKLEVEGWKVYPVYKLNG